MNKRYYVVMLELDETHEGAPDDEEVKLQLERALLEGTPEEEFGITNAKAVVVDFADLHPATRRQLLQA